MTIPNVDSTGAAGDAGSAPEGVVDGGAGAPVEGGKPALPAEVAEVLAEYNIEADEDGRIAVTDHAKLLATLKTLRSQVKDIEAATEKQRLESLSDQERAIEEAKAAARAEVEAEYRATLVKAQAEAAAVAAGFADPADIGGFLDLSGLNTEAEVKAAVAALAEAKPYLLKSAPKPAQPIGQGPKAPANPTASPSDWLRSAVTGGRL